MKKNELVEKVAEGASLTKADAERAINALVNAVSEALVEGDKVALKGLGTCLLYTSDAADDLGAV